MRRLLCGVCLWAGITLLQAAPAAQVRVILWFDTEDYILPADDEACKRLAQMLTDRHIRATFKVVGEKARVLESRGRRDVIAALKKHDIAYHANLHSVHPTPTEYLADCGLEEGVEEFVRREGGGAEDVRRIFSVSTLGCYGQPGSSWAPQAIAALPRLRVAPHDTPCYVDEGDHVGLNQKPFWYMGALTVYHMGQNWTRMELHEPAALEPAKEKVSKIAARLSGEGDGLISIFYHPCEWVHRQFWDGVNFSRGANPPREDWKLPPQRSQRETDEAFLRFGKYIDHIRALPGVRFVTATELPLLYPDSVRTQGASRADLTELASRLVQGAQRGIDFQLVGDRAYSPADQFELLARAVADLAAGRKTEFPLVAKGVLGPSSAPPSSSVTNPVPWPAFRDAALDTADFVSRRRALPSRVFIGADAVAPGQFLIALAEVWLRQQKGGQLPNEAIHIGPSSELLTARHIASDTPGLFGGWVIHKENFQAPKLLELARLQAWTLKPAIPK